MSVSRRTIGRRTIAAVAAFSMITSGTIAMAPAAFAADIADRCSTKATDANIGDGTVTCANVDGIGIVAGSTITLKLEGFADRSEFGERVRNLNFKIDAGAIKVPEDEKGTSFDMVGKKGNQTYGVISEVSKLPGKESKDGVEVKIRLPKDISTGEHRITILGGSNEAGKEATKISKTVHFTVEEASTEVRAFPGGRLTSRVSGSKIEGVARGTKVDLEASRLAPGMKVIHAGVIGGDNLLPEGAVFQTDEAGKVVVPEITVPDNAPLDAPFGIIVENINTGEKFSADNRRYGVTINEQDNNADMIKVEKSVHTPTSLYQSAYSSSQKKLFVTRAFGKDGKSALMTYNPDTLELEKSTLPAEIKDASAGLPTVDHIFGIAIDEKNGNIWTTRTIGTSMTVFDLETGAVKKHFAKENHGLAHPFGVEINGDTVYVSDVTSRSKETVGKNTIKLYDAKTLAEKGTIDIPFMPLGALHMVINDNKLYTVDFSGKKAAIVDLNDTTKITEIDLENPTAPGDRGAGIALDTKRERLWIATQSPSWVKVVDLKTNEVINKEGIRTGASPLDVLYDAKNDVIWSMNRVGASVNIIDPDTLEIKATRNLDLVDTQAAYLNQLSTDGMGNIFVTSKPTRDQGTEDVLFKLSYNAPEKEEPKGGNNNQGDNNQGNQGNQGGDNNQGNQGQQGNQGNQGQQGNQGNQGQQGNQGNQGAPADKKKAEDESENPSSSPKISISSENEAKDADKGGDKDGDKDGSSKGAGIFGIIALIAAILGGLGFAAVNGMIPGFVMPAIPGLPMPK